MPLTGYAHAHLVRCRDCSLVFAERRPSDDEIQDHYDGYPRTDLDSAITRRRYRELLRSFEPYRRTGRILDVGCGIGFFLEEARSCGWEPYGTEYGERAVEINRAKGLNIADASAGPGVFDERSFDIVTAFEVIEHVRDPGGEISAIAKLLRPGGLFYCTTPNFNSFSRFLLRDRWSVIEYPEHLNYFTVGTLSALLERGGLVTVNVVSSGFSVHGVRARITRVGAEDSDPGTSDQQLRSRIEESRLLRGVKGTINLALAAVRAGDSLKGRFELRGPGVET